MCYFESSSRLPSKAEFEDQVASGGPAKKGWWWVIAPTLDRCQTIVGKGSYLYRARWNVSLQLKSGWPLGIEYLEYRDAAMWTSIDLFSKSTPVKSGFNRPNFNGTRLDPLYMQRWGFAGDRDSYLTELCFAERCKFSMEETGLFSSINGAVEPIAHAQISMCFRYEPQGDAGFEETVRCQEYSGTDSYAHPGLFGTTVTISGSILLEPLLTWRR